MTSDDEFLFAVSEFDSIYDNQPKQSALTLAELTEGLMRFVLSPELQWRFLKKKRKSEEAWEAWQKGEHLGGKHWTYLARAKRKAEHEREDVDAAVAAKYKKMLGWAKDEIKGAVRVWSPTYYEPNVPKRGTTYLTHASCLVLDYDSGVTMEDATSDWSSWFHIVHTSWSHKWESHRFRLILPLAHPVYPADWPPLWNWAYERSGKMIDSAPSSPGNVFVLPAVPDSEWPRQAYVRGGSLLDPSLRGLVPKDRIPPPPVPVDFPEESHFRGGRESKEYVQGGNCSDEDFEMF